MDWMYANCSTTAQRGALDWYPKFYEATKPVFRALYEAVEKGDETRRCVCVVRSLSVCVFLPLCLSLSLSLCVCV